MTRRRSRKSSSGAGRAVPLHRELELDDCWNRIGIWGTESPRCERLARLGHCHNCDVYAAAGRRLLDRTAPEGYLEEWQGLLAQDRAATDKKQRPLLMFRVGGQHFALPTQCFDEIAAECAPRRLPHNRDPVLLGVASVRGELLACASLKALLMPGQEEAAEKGLRPGLSQRSIVVRFGDVRFVCPVDDILGVQRTSEDDMFSYLGEVSSLDDAFVEGVFPFRDFQVIALKAAKLENALMGVVAR